MAKLELPDPPDEIDAPALPAAGVDRRTFLRALAAAGAGGAVASVLGTTPSATAATLDPAAMFPDGLKAGDPAPDGAVLWTRVAAPVGAARTSGASPFAPLSPAQRRQLAGAGKRSAARGDAVTVLWVVAEDAGLQRIASGGVVTARPESGYTVKVRAKGLRPDRWYHYRFFAQGVGSRVGRLRTAPRPGAMPDLVRYGFASCQQRGIRGLDGRESLYVTHRAIADDDLDFLIHLGDYVYVSDGGTLSVEDYRGVYRRFHSNPLLQDLQARVPLVAVWDDGEFYNGVDRTGPPQRLANARQAWFEMMPVARNAQDRIHRRFAWGRLADFLMLDVRMFRDPEVPANTNAGPIEGQDSTRPPSDQMFAPGRTTLGAAQKRWLERELVRSRSAWRVIGSSYNVCPWKITDFDTPLNRSRHPELPPNAAIYVSNEAWDDYAIERRELLQFLVDRGVDNVVFNSGHTHFYLASELMPNYDDDASPVAAFDFVTGSQTADPDPREIAPETLLRFVQNLMMIENSPYMKEVNLLDQGYVRVELTPEECLVSFRYVDTFDPDARARTGIRFRVVAGSRAIEVLPGDA
jgi:alkaline phosphatase D